MAPQTRQTPTNAEDDTLERLLVHINTAFDTRDQLSQQREQEREQRFLAAMIEQIKTNSAPQQPPSSSSSILGSGPHHPPRTSETSPETHANRHLRLTFPRFSSGDPVDWLFSVQRYFMYYATPQEDKLLLASMHLDTPASCWFQSMAQAGRLTNWDAFVSGLKKRFGPSEYSDPAGQLMKLSQTASVVDYQNKFEALASKVTGFTSDMLKSSFISGLHPRIQRAVIAQRPRDLDDAFALARVFEDQFADTRSIPKPWSARPTPQSLPIAPAMSEPPNKLPIRRLTAAEQHERRAKGLCFNCDDRFTPGHRCKGRASLLFLEVEDNASDEVATPVLDLLVQPSEEQPSPEISLNAFLGQRSPKSMSMTGSINGHPIQVLIDSGSTNNFISNRMSSFLTLPTSPTQPFKVRVGSGAYLQCHQICNEVSLFLQSHTFNLDLFVLDIEGADVVLGIQWLATLGPILTNYAALTMEFCFQGQNIKLSGDASLLAHPLSPAGLNKMVASGGVSSCFMCFQATPTSKDPLFFTTNTEQQSPIWAVLLDEFSEVFTEPSTLPPPRAIDHCIPLHPNIEAVNVRPYRYPYFQKNEIERQVSELLKTGVIRPSRSPFSSPVILVKKKDGTWRFCVDYRALNAATIKDKFPIPTVDELIDELHGAVIFSKLDLRSGYHQVRMRESDVHKTAFRTHHGHFEFLVMPFGLTNAPSTFQAMMNEVFQPYLRKFVVIFFDDILVYSSSQEEHMGHLRQIFSTLQEHNLVVKRSKCIFGSPSVDFLGHIISPQGVRADPSKIEAITAWPMPLNQRQVRGFLGLTGYYRHFIRHYASIAAPLTDILTKEGFKWSDRATEAFKMLKSAMTSAPVLALPDFSSQFVLETDASGVGIGAVLMQHSHPIAFYSRKLSKTMQGKSTYVREIFAVQSAVAKWRQYLLGNHFIIRTDHRSLQNMLKQTIQTPEQQQFLSKLVGYSYSIEYKSGPSNAVADALSRVPECADSMTCQSSSAILTHQTKDTAIEVEPDHRDQVFLAISRPVSADLKILEQEVANDSYCQQIMAEISPNKSTVAGWSFSHGLLRYRGRIYLPENSTLIPILLAEYHSTLLGGHSGVQRTIQRLAPHFYWKKMQQHVKDYVHSCDICQKCKPTNQHPYGLLQPIAPPTSLWADISMDFITHLPPSEGHTAILVVVDRFSKGVHLAALPRRYNAPRIAAIFWESVGKIHGMPKSIISDRDPIFQSNFWKELFKLQGTKLNFSSAYHPESDGQTERVNRCIEQYLRAFVHDQPKKWATLLSWAEYHHNTTFQASASMTPFEVMFGYKPPSMLNYCSGTSAFEAVDSDLRSRDVILAQLRDNLLKSQKAMKFYTDKTRTAMTFEPGQLVLLKLQPYRQLTARPTSAHKLGLRYYGPFKVERRIGTVAYLLALPPTTRIHPVFHCSLLKPYHGHATPHVHDLPNLAEDNHPVHQPIAILARRTILRNGESVPQALIQWSGLLLEDSSWEDFVNVDELRLEDKSSSHGGGNVTPVNKPLKFYMRRNRDKPHQIMN
ncbi:polyprotein [Rhynchospora pubera]|uniref:Polyprotein n=1 Tax=Rhynchospora pubera TaxID=906938 RepID=A0AAV8CTJ3_9POAL|nr:polyprotein [Rhynchospora pubera]